MAKIIAFQGAHGANSEVALKKYSPQAESLPCTSFEQVFTALEENTADLAFIPVENSIAGRVADIHHLLPQANVHIIAEHFEPIHHQLMALPGTTLNDLTEVHSHVHALGQCRTFIQTNKLKPVVHADTAGAASDVATWQDKTKGAIATKLAAELYGLTILAENIEDHEHNTTRFLLLSKEPSKPSPDEPVITSLFFTLRSVPAALYKAIGGFATNGINMTKLESYLTGESFQAAQFYADVEGHPDSVAMQHALEELEHFTSEVRIVGTYPASQERA